MLVRNPITSLLYEHGYDGNEDIFKYWKRHHKELIEWISGLIDKGQLTYHDLEVFELKVRWASNEGMWFRFDTKSFFRKGNAFEGFEKIKFKVGPRRLYLQDFYDKFNDFVKEPEGQDLRGVSLLKVKFHDAVIKDVDFSNACLDFSTFNRVDFVNCKFEETTFYRCRFKECTFDCDCVMVDNDFGRALLDSEFACEIKDPEVVEPGWFDKKVKRLMDTGLFDERLPLRFTYVRNDSFKKKTRRTKEVQE